MNDKNIYVATTGGTIDSFYNPHEPAPHFVPQDGMSFVQTALEHLGVSDQCDANHYGTYDSKDLPKKVIDNILRDAMAKGYSKILITMGTDAMPDMANYAKKSLAKYGKRGADACVIFTGSMQPLRDENKAFFAQSDGVENLEFAVNALSNHTHKGVYVAMHVSGQNFTRLLNPEFLKKVVRTDKDSNSASDEARVVGSGFFYDEQAADLEARRAPPQSL